MTPTTTSSSGATARQKVEQPKPQGAAGPFVLNLCSSTTPMALSNPDQPELKRFSFFVSRRFEEGRERFRLHMGYFETLKEAEEWLTAVRDIYPGAWAGEAPGKKLRERAVAAAAAVAQHAAGPPPHLNVPTVHAATAPSANSTAPTKNVPVAKAAPVLVPQAGAVTQRPTAPSLGKAPTSGSGAPAPNSASPKAASVSHVPALQANTPAQGRASASLSAVAPAQQAARSATSSGAHSGAAAGARPAIATSTTVRNLPVAVPVAKAAQPAKGGVQPAHGSHAVHGPQVAHGSQAGHGAQGGHGSNAAHGSQSAHGSQVGHGSNAAHGSQSAHGSQVGHGSNAAHGSQPAHGSQAGHGSHGAHGSSSNAHQPASGGAGSARAQGTSAARSNSKGGAKAALPNSNVREVLKALGESPAEPEVTGETRMMPAPVLAGLDAISDTGSFSDTQVLKYLETRRADGSEISGVDVETGAISLLKPDDTGTRRALKEAVAENAPVWFAVQLQWSVQPVELAKVPPLAIFSAYTLYTVEGSRDGRKWYGLRLGFFSDAISAKQVAYYVRSEFTSVAVVPVSPQERTRASDVDKKAELAFPKKARSEPVDEFKLIDSDAHPLPKPQPVAAKPAVPAKTAPAAGAAAAAGRRVPKANARVRARETRAPQTLEETLEILGAGELEMDNGNGESINESGVRHLRVEVQKNTPFGRLLERLSERVRKP